jgi:hypothetical protein
MAPISTKGETYNDFFPKSLFEAKLQKNTPEWVKTQIDADFQEIASITADAVETTYREIREKIGGERILHYRILDNKLYKYVPDTYQSRDSRLEKAFKTLLTCAKVPDLDFLLCPMDGVPEVYMPQDFFLTSHQSPIFGQAKLKEPLSRFIILIPDQFSLSQDWYHLSQEILVLNNQISWEEKCGNALWRGGLTDHGLVFENRELDRASLYSSPRFLIGKLSNAFPNEIDAGIHWPSHVLLQEERVLKSSVDKREHLLHKYLPVIDGHLCTYPGYQWRLLSNSVAFKQDSNQIQWFYGALEPYIHFVPVANDMSDLIDKISWAKFHDTKAQQITLTAQKFVREHLMIEDNYFFLLQVIKRYALVQKIDFERLKAEMTKDPKWICIQYRKRAKFERAVRRFFYWHKCGVKKQSFSLL